MAKNVGVTFNGKRIIQPSAHTKVDASALMGSSSANYKKIALLGTSIGGEPNKILEFSSAIEARDTLKGGDLLKAGVLAWNPSPDGIGANDIVFVRCADGCLQATKTIGNMKFKSLDYGAYTNKISVKLTEGTQPGSLKLTAAYYPDEIIEIMDNIGVIFSVGYEGSATSVKLDITEVGQTKKLTISEEDSVIMSYTLGDGEWSSLAKILANINEHEGFTAKMNPKGDKNIKSDGLDVVADVDLKGKTVNVLGVQADMLHQLRYSSLVSLEFTDKEIPTAFDTTYLEGGADGTFPAQLTKQLNLLIGEGITMVVPLTGDYAIHQEVQEFVLDQSQDEHSLMLGFFGGDLGETVDQTISRAVSLNSSRSILCYPGISKTPLLSEDENVEMLAPYFTAALIAGRCAGKETGDPITLDNVSISTVEVLLDNGQINRLLQMGVTPIKFVRNAHQKGYRIAQGLTTYQDDNNAAFREISVRMVTDELCAELVDELETNFVGGRGTHAQLALLKNHVQSFLDRKVREQVIVEYDPGSVTVELLGDVVYVQYTCTPTCAINYILITTKYNQPKFSA